MPPPAALPPGILEAARTAVQAINCDTQKRRQTPLQVAGCIQHSPSYAAWSGACSYRAPMSTRTHMATHLSLTIDICKG